MSGLKQEVLPFSLSPKSAQGYNLVQHVQQRQSISPSNGDSELLPDIVDLKGQSTAVNEKKIRLDLHSGMEIDIKNSQQHPSSSNDEVESYANERANKYKGPPSTWTGCTASERALARSLDHLKAKDLAVHLYNVYHLKYKAKWSDDGEAWSQGWKLLGNWTAWPLAPDMAPRVDDGHDWVGADFQQPFLIQNMQGPQVQELQDVLVARVLRIATKRNKDLGQQDGEATLFETERESLFKDDSTIYVEQEIMNELKPVIMRDDDIAKNVLLPSVCHIMTQLDQLLMGLHHARDSYAYQSSQRPTRDLNSAKALARGPQLKKSCPSTTSARENDSVCEGSSWPKLESSRDRSRSPPRRNPRGSIRTRMAQRDWGDVLGVAAMTGWDSKTVSRAAYRCGTLFGEGIKFRKLEENGDDPIETTFLPGAPYRSDSDTNDNEEIVEEERPSSPAHGAFGNNIDFGWKFYCTVDWCRRSSYGFMDYNLAKRHFRRVHPGLDLPHWPQTTEGHELGQTDRPSSPPLGPGDDLEPVYKFYCPATSCRRSMDYMNGSRCLRYRSGFAEYRSIRRHMQKTHPDLEIPENPQVEDHGDEGEAESDAEMFGGVHVDGFLQPIMEVPSWTARREVKSFSRHSSRSKR